MQRAQSDTQIPASQLTVLITGSGVLASYLANLLSWLRYPAKVVVAGRNEQAALEAVNSARLAAYNQGHYPDIASIYIDLDDVERTADTLGRLQPEIVVNASSIQSYWKISTLPAADYLRLSGAGLGPWLPMHLSPAYNLMRAISTAECSATVVNAAYPDAVNAVLHAQGLAPTIGIGNVMNVVPALRAAASMVIDHPVDRIDIRLVAHHYTSNRLPSVGSPGDAPYHLSVMCDGSPLTEQIDDAKLFERLPKEIRRTRGSAGMYVTASSAYAVLNALVSDEPVRLHAPGPHGLPGGYPVRIGNRHLELDLPIGCSRDQAIDINVRAQCFDGIDRIDPDGRVVFADHAVDILDRAMGYECRSMRPEECHQHAAEMRAKYLAFEEICQRVAHR